MIFGVFVGEAVGVRMKGESFSSGVGAPVETGDEAGAWIAGAGSAFFASKGGQGDSEGGATGSEGGGVTLDGLDSAFIGAGSEARCFNMRMLPVWRSVWTGSASAINCSIFFMGEEGRADPVGVALADALAGVATPAGGRRTTPCMAGNVRVLLSTDSVFNGAGVVAVWGACGPSATGTGLTVGGRRSGGAGFRLSGAD